MLEDGIEIIHLSSLVNANVISDVISSVVLNLLF